MSITLKRSHFIFQKTERDLLKLASSQQPDRVHRFRTAARRLQTLLEEIVPERTRNQKKLLKLLGQLRKRAGKVRDLDVQLAALRSLKIPQEPRRKTRFMHQLVDLRAKHEHKLRKTLDKEVLREVKKRLKRASAEVKLEDCREPLQVARQILGQVDRPAGPLSAEVLHHYRVAVKSARYAAEFEAKSGVKSDEATEFIAQVKTLQDAVGDWHDWLTLTHTASARLGHVHHSPLLAALNNITGGKFRRAATALSTSRVVPPSRQPSVVPPSGHFQRNHSERDHSQRALTTLAARAGSAA